MIQITTEGSLATEYDLSEGWFEAAPTDLSEGSFEGRLCEGSFEQGVDMSDGEFMRTS